ncbi:MAG: hypothetical protein HC810_02580 [Acaryochloridaceae cyanobacterium RL_2_7]|nr:hypothetical protein [Acaryochloridaceae cyanobacterium RL_2_7]
MYSQFRAQYPNASLTSDLLVAEAGHYVVQAVVKVAGAEMASGLSSAASIEVAEDQARARALMVLGIQTNAYHPSVQLLENSSKELPPGSPAQLTPAPQSQMSSEDAWQGDWNWPQSDSLDPIEAESPEEAMDSVESYLPHPQHPGGSPPPELNGGGLKAPAGRKKSLPKAPRKQAIQSTKNAPPQPIDLSDVIAETDVELKRLGWSHVQGRQFLEQTYQKRSRQQLTDSELLEFLEYLKVQSGTQDPPF